MAVRLPAQREREADFEAVRGGAMVWAARKAARHGEFRRGGLMKFEPIYYGERLTILNEEGDVGIATLWSPVSQVRRKITEIDASILRPEVSRVAVIANLYGEGLAQMLSNLLWNPQIRWILALGQDLSESGADLVSVIEQGVIPDKFLGRPVWRIRTTDTILDGRIDPSPLRDRVRVIKLGKLSEPSTVDGIRQFFSEVQSRKQVHLVTPRIRMEIPPMTNVQFPSDALDHTVRRQTPLMCWNELVFRVMRFGHRVTLNKGPRIELLNVKTIITAPREDCADALGKYGFSLDRFRSYQSQILNPIKPAEITYTYGNRLRRYFTRGGQFLDALDAIAVHLRADAETRRGYAVTWDNTADLADDHEGNEEAADESAAPCLTTLFFRRLDNKLSLTATFRSHNLMRAWLENVYGLMAIQSFVCDAVEMRSGPITVISHSLTIDPSISHRLAIADSIVSCRRTDDDVDPLTGKHQLRLDPMGYFDVSLDTESREVVVQHKSQGLTLREYRAQNSEELFSQLARDCALSLVSHGLWLGREVARAEAKLQHSDSKTK